MTSLTKEEQNRYHRQLIIPQVGEEGQEKLKMLRCWLSVPEGWDLRYFSTLQLQE